MSTEQEKYANTSQAKGAWKRESTKFQDVVSTGPDAKFPVEKGRYRLYVNYVCPWAHRTIILRKLKGLEDAIPITFTSHIVKYLGHKFDSRYKGWDFKTENNLNTLDEPGNIFYEPHGFETISELYELSKPGYTKECHNLEQNPSFSVPVLFDELTQTIVNNESADIVKMFNSSFDEFASNPQLDLNPNELQEKMSAFDAVIYPKVNDGVYRCGFAQTQAAYLDAYKAHWEGMEEVERILGENRFLTGDTFTLSDVRLFVTLIRYDPVYFSRFKTSKRMVREMPNMLRFLKEVYNMPGIKETINVSSFVKAYYNGEVYPLGPLEPDYYDYLDEVS
jgi:putative glutathione S-transferase